MDNFQIHSLGHRAFFLFLLKRIKAVAVLFLFTALAWYSVHFFPDPYSLWVDYFSKIVLLLSTAYFAFIFIVTYLEYRRHTYHFTEEAFIMTHGYMTSNEIGAVYHQIQSVNIKRTPLDRMIGVSQIVIIMTGAERDPHHSQITLPGVGKKKSKLVQQELLMRARKHAMPQRAS